MTDKQQEFKNSKKIKFQKEDKPKIEFKEEEEEDSFPFISFAQRHFNNSFA